MSPIKSKLRLSEPEMLKLGLEFLVDERDRLKEAIAFFKGGSITEGARNRVEVINWLIAKLRSVQ